MSQDFTPTSVMIHSLDASQLLELFHELKETINQIHQPTPETVLMSREDTADLLGVSLPTVYNWTKKGIITAYHLGNRVYYKKHEVINAMSATNTPVVV